MKPMITKLKDFTVAQYLELGRVLPKFITLDRVSYEKLISIDCAQMLTEEFNDYISLFDKQEFVPKNIKDWVSNATDSLWETARMGESVNGKKNIETITTDELIQTVIAYVLLRLSTNKVLVTEPTREIFGNIIDIFYLCHRHRINAEIIKEIRKKYYANKNPHLYLINRQATISLSKDVVVSRIFKVLIEEIEKNTTFLWEGCLVLSSDGQVQYIKDFEEILYHNEISTNSIVNVVSVAGHNSNFFYLLTGTKIFCHGDENCTLKGKDWHDRTDLETMMYKLANEIWESYLIL